MLKSILKYFKLLNIIAFFLVTGCSSNPGDYSDTENGDLALYNNKTLFSSLNELDYEPIQETSSIGVGDVLSINVFRAPELSNLERSVDFSGNISLPLIGEINVVGLEQTELERKISRILQQKYLQEPQASVLVKESKSQSITVEGWVRNPNVYSISNKQVTLLSGIALAGGLDSLADTSNVVLLRKKGDVVKAYKINLDTVRDGKMKNPYVRNNDIIMVHRSNNKYWLREVTSAMGAIGGVASFTNIF